MARPVPVRRRGRRRHRGRGCRGRTCRGCRGRGVPWPVPGARVRRTTSSSAQLRSRAPSVRARPEGAGGPRAREVDGCEGGVGRVASGGVRVGGREAGDEVAVAGGGAGAAEDPAARLGDGGGGRGGGAEDAGEERGGDGGDERGEVGGGRAGWSGGRGGVGWWRAERKQALVEWVARVGQLNAMGFLESWRGGLEGFEVGVPGEDERSRGGG